MLLTLLSPAIQSARVAARRTVCANNLGNIGVAYSGYVSRGLYPKALAPSDWIGQLKTTGGNDLPVACPEGTAEIGIESMYCRVTHGGWPEQSIPFHPGPRCLKKNETATSYELWFEDWNDWDFADLRVSVQLNPAGADKISVTLLNSSSTFDIVSPDGVALLPGLTSKNWRGQACDAVKGSASYGMNSRCAAFKERDGQKILVLDYSKKVADVVGPDAHDLFRDRVAVRHGELCNVLFVNGRVSSFLPEAIDPSILAIQDKLWKAEVDPPMAPR